MYSIFKDYGKIDEVVIPLKMDMRGKRYSVARFNNVGDIRVMVKKLDNIVIGK